MARVSVVAIGFLCGAQLTCRAGGQDPRKASVEPPAATRSCLDSLRIALARDTIGLQHRTVDTVTASSTGGVSVSEFRSPAGRKRLEAVYLGETGRATYRFHWASPGSFVLHVIDESYGAPLSMGAPVVERIYEQFYYVCAGRALADSTGVQLTRAQAVLGEADSILR